MSVLVTNKANLFSFSCKINELQPELSILECYANVKPNNWTEMNERNESTSIENRSLSNLNNENEVQKVSQVRNEIFGYPSFSRLIALII